MKGIGIVLGMLAGMAIAFAILVSCKSTPAQDALTIQTQADVTAYAAEELGCVAGSATRAYADACIAQVKARWCGPGGTLQQAGACGDAGAEASLPLPAILQRIYGVYDAGDTALAVGASLPGAPGDAGGDR